MLNGRLRENKKKTLDKETLYIGARLRAIRESRGLSQRALARRAGVTNGIISLIGQNRNSPSVASLKKVLEGIPLPLAEFFADSARALCVGWRIRVRLC
jgi:transcriptional regulator with XRE-family HTH domain